jgi:hypothetical protein
MATSFTKAALGAEGVGKDVTMIIGNGYTKIMPKSHFGNYARIRSCVIISISDMYKVSTEM